MGVKMGAFLIRYKKLFEQKGLQIKMSSGMSFTFNAVEL